MSYKQFVTAAQDRLTSSSRDTIQPPGHGIIEYARDGSGLPALVSHPLFGGFDVGLGVGRKFLGPDFSIIAPSRFGYLGSTLPTAALPADQADAFAAVLDTLDLAPWLSWATRRAARRPSSSRCVIPTGSPRWCWSRRPYPGRPGVRRSPLPTFCLARTWSFGFSVEAGRLGPPEFLGWTRASGP